VKLLSSFMSENFMARGGDNEAILILLLVPRMTWKISILATQVKEKFVSADQVCPEKQGK
jgi:dynactin 1